MSAPRKLPGVLALAVLGISISGPLARLADAAPLAIAAWRMGLALSVVGVMLLITGSHREWRALARRDLLVALGAGALLAVHFWTWIASLGMTSVAASVLLVNLHPVVIVAGSALWLGEKPTRGQLAGLALALVGAIIVGAGDALSAPAGGAATAAAVARRTLQGNALALVGAVTVGLYYLAGRSLRQRLSLWPYVGLVYASCFVTLLVFAALTRTPLWPVGARTLGIFAAIALGPMIAGHTGFNWALRYVPAYLISLLLLLEPLGAGVIAWWLFDETASGAVLVGGALVLAGLAWSVRAEDGSKSGA
jgi:drug/metabolite transporter (DMT)-like permease